MEDYHFIDKAVFFPKQGILVIGDLHLGYEAMLRQSGVLVPERQVQDVIKNFENIFQDIKKQGHSLNKIVFLGDLKHAFYFDRSEINEFRKIMDFLKKHFNEKNIILIKGNHDTIDYTFEDLMLPYHLEEDLLFLHGHQKASDYLINKAKIIVMGHTHPCVVFNKGAKTEAYKCFLEGQHKGKKVIIMPSFLDIIEGTPVNDYEEEYVEQFSLIPKKDIMDFKIYAIGDKKVLDFGKIKDL